MLLVIKIISSFIFISLTINVAYFLFFSLAGKLGKIKVTNMPVTFKKIIVLIPAYKEDIVILHTAQDALNQNYPKDKFDVMVIADSLKPETIEKLKQIPVFVHEVTWDRSTKIKSLNSAINSISGYDTVVILDSDNLMSHDFLAKMNRELQKGFLAVQGHRIAKNEDTNMAFLDAMSEEINNHLFRKGHYIAGFSSALIGSAMAFDFDFFKRMIISIDSVGEDKVLELLILKEKVKIVYAEDALVYDEKVQNIEVFGNQRKRWLSSQLSIFKEFFFPSFIELFKNGNIDYFNKAFQSALIPRVLLLGFLFVMTMLGFLLPLFPSGYLWAALFAIYIITLMVAVPSRFYNKKLLLAILQIPKVFLKMFMLLFKLKGADKTFINTPHTTTVKKD